MNKERAGFLFGGLSDGSSRSGGGFNLAISVEPSLETAPEEKEKKLQTFLLPFSPALLGREPPKEKKGQQISTIL